MKASSDAVRVKNVDQAVVAALELIQDFSESEPGKRLTPKQLLAAVTIAAVEHASLLGLPGQSASATLSDLAEGAKRR